MVWSWTMDHGFNGIRNIFTIVIEVNVCQKKLTSDFRHVTPKKWCWNNSVLAPIFLQLLFLTISTAIMCGEKLDISQRNFFPLCNVALLSHVQTCEYRSKVKKISFTCLCNIYHVHHWRNSHFVILLWKIPHTCSHKLPWPCSNMQKI